MFSLNYDKKLSNNRSIYMMGYSDGALKERNRLYETIDRMLLVASHSDVPSEEIAIIERTLLQIKNYFPNNEKK